MRKWDGRLALAGALVAALLALACAASGPPPPAETAVGAEIPYVIGAGDRVQVRVWKNDELSVEAPVRPDGNISVPLLDDVKAAGLTAEELKAVITRELSEFIANPDVTVVVIQTGSKRVSVIGEVQRPGPQALATRLRVLEALSGAGGFGPFADKGDVQIIRYVDGKETIYHFDFDAYVSGKAPGTNLLLEPGDTVVVHD